MRQPAAPRLDFETDITMDVPPTAAPAPSGIVWTPASDAPSRGVTPAAAHASATGAELAKRVHSARTKRLLVLFLQHERLTIAEASELLNLKEKSVCPLWNRLEHRLEWIEGMQEYFTYHIEVGRRRIPIRREYHRLTARGRAVAMVVRGGGA